MYQIFLSNFQLPIPSFLLAGLMLGHDNKAVILFVCSEMKMSVFFLITEASCMSLGSPLLMIPEICFVPFCNWDATNEEVLE